MLLSDPLHGPARLLPAEWRDHPEWHLGRERYWLWSIPVDCPALLARLRAARGLLGGWLHPPGERQAHVTLFVCGFPSTAPARDDDIAPAVLEAQREALAALRLSPFTLHIGGLDSFASAAFLSVADDGRLEPLRRVLGRLAGEVRQAPYVPHLTIGLYRRAVGAATWRRRAEPLRDCPPLALPVRELQLVSYATAELQGPLRIEARVALAG